MWTECSAYGTMGLPGWLPVTPANLATGAAPDPGSPSFSHERLLTGRSQWHSRALLRLSLTGWVILSVVGVAQLLVVLDATIVNIALPSAYLVVHHTGPLAPSIAATRGYTLAFAVSAGVLGLGAILAVVLLPSRHRLAELRNAATAAIAAAPA